MKSPIARQLSMSLAIIAGTLAAGILGAYFILADVSAQADIIAKYRATTAAVSNNLSLLANLSQDSTKAEQYRAAMGQLLPSEDALVKFPGEVRTMAASYNVSVDVALTGEPIPAVGGSAGYVPFSFAAAGDSDDLFNFLRAVETQSTQFLTTVRSVDFQLTSARGQLAATGQVFFQ